MREQGHRGQRSGRGQSDRGVVVETGTSPDPGAEGPNSYFSHLIIVVDMVFYFEVLFWSFILEFYFEGEDIFVLLFWF